MYSKRLISMRIYCCGCKGKISARLTNGREIYPHRPDLFKIPFWKCDACRNYVGCHYKTSTPTKPLGVIPTPEVRRIRGKLHKLIDPVWKEWGHSRSKVYKAISKELGYSYHSGNVFSTEEAKTIYDIVTYLRNNVWR